MFSFRKRIIFLAITLYIPGFLSAQFFSEPMSVEALRPFWTTTGFGMSSFSLQNNTLLSGDISSTQSNPAFLINIKRPKASLSTNNLFNNYKSSLNGTNSGINSETNTFYTDYFGFAYPLPVYQGAMVLAVSYEPSVYYYSTLKSGGTVSFTEGAVSENMDIKESGVMNTLRFTGAVEFMPNFNVGLSMNFHSGNRSYESIKTENADAIDTNTDDYPDITYLETIKPEYNGFNMDLGMSYQSDIFKFGIRLTTPLKLHVHELSRFTEQYIYDEAWSIGASRDSTTDYNIEYTSRYPWEVAPSFAVRLGSMTLGVDLIIHNWQDIEVDQLTNNDDVNRDLYWNLRRTTDIGLSMALPLGKTISTRFAYRRIPSPYAEVQNNDEEINHLIGASVETILMKSLILGFSYQRAFGNQTVSHPYFGTYSTQSYTNDRLSISLAILL
ncbi:MAG: hypothetical protein JXR87_09675 [Candidatus Marinimicrobia bacterium]|nr:hypothetical protein [Candidatus Neomarinimicrobiota bacterium]